MAVKVSNEIGNITISENVLAVIAGSAVTGCTGVVGSTGKKGQEGIGAFWVKENLGKGIKVRVEENVVSVDISITIEYGVKISQLAEKIMVTVKGEVEKIAGVEVDKVNVLVEGIKVDK